MPLELFIQQMAIASKIRLGDLIKCSWRGTNKTGTQLGHIKYLESLEEELEIRTTTTDRCRELNRHNRCHINKARFGSETVSYTHLTLPTTPYV